MKLFYSEEEAAAANLPEDGTYIQHYIGCGAIFERKFMYVGRCPKCNKELRFGGAP